MEKTDFLNLYSMMMADGIMQPAEMAVLFRIGQESYGLTPKEITTAIKDGGINEQIVVPASEKDRLKILFQMAVVAWADNEIVPEEKELLLRYAIAYGIEKSVADAFVDFLLEQVKSGISFENFIQQLNN